MMIMLNDKLSAVLTCGLLFCFFTFNRLSDGKEYCHNEDFVGECTGDDVILITAALYGRMTKGTCAQTDFGFIGCNSNVITQLHERCSGRYECSIHVPDAVLDKSKPCNEDLKSYLDVNYTCVKVAHSVADTCDLVALTESSVGYISSKILPPPSLGGRGGLGGPPCGSESIPWVIRVLPGQKISVTLLDFTSFTVPPGMKIIPQLLQPLPQRDTAPVEQLDKLRYQLQPKGEERPAATVTSRTSTTPRYSTTSSGESRRMSTGVGECDRYAVFIEESGERSHLCGSGRVQHLHAHTSSSNVLKIIIVQKQEEGYNFLLKYETVGCPGVHQTPSNVWFRREGDYMNIGCVTSDITWRLVCNGTRWEGPQANCSLPSGQDARREDGLPTLSMGVSLLIVLAVALAFGLGILLAGLLYMKRRICGQGMGSLNMQMRDMKPLSCDTPYEAAMYARNAAFVPMKGSGEGHPQSCKASRRAVPLENDKYEYVWDMPSSMIQKISTAERPDLVQVDPGTGEELPGRGGSRGVLLEDEPCTSSLGQCSCLRQFQTLPGHVTAVTPRSDHHKPITTQRGSSCRPEKFSSLEARSRRLQQQQKTDKHNFASGVKTCNTGKSGRKTCRQCGHCISEYTAGPQASGWEDRSGEDTAVTRRTGQVNENPTTSTMSKAVQTPTLSRFLAK